MTIRPVFERPRVLRTLLCLLVGVLALLWRAVPSFSWNPSSCPNWPHDHTMCIGDVAFFSGASYSLEEYPGDDFRVAWLFDGAWRAVPPGSCYGYYTLFRLYTYGDPGYGQHTSGIEQVYRACICNIWHCCDWDEQWWHYPGQWCCVGQWQGSSIVMGWTS